MMMQLDIFLQGVGGQETFHPAIEYSKLSQQNGLSRKSHSSNISLYDPPTIP